MEPKLSSVVTINTQIDTAPSNQTLTDSKKESADPSNQIAKSIPLVVSQDSDTVMVSISDQVGYKHALRFFKISTSLFLFSFIGQLVTHFFIGSLWFIFTIIWCLAFFISLISFLYMSGRGLNNFFLRKGWQPLLVALVYLILLLLVGYGSCIGILFSM